MILLFSIALDGSIAIPVEYESGTLAWLRVQPIGRLNFILGKFLGLLFAFTFSLIVLLVLVKGILLTSGIAHIFQPVGIWLYAFALGIFMSSLGLTIGSIFRTQKSSIGVTLLIFLLMLIFPLLNLWLQIRPLPSTYDPLYYLARIVTFMIPFIDLLSPVGLLDQQLLELSFKEFGYSLLLIAFGCLWLILGVQNLKRMTYLK